MKFIIMFNIIYLIKYIIIIFYQCCQRIYSSDYFEKEPLSLHQLSTILRPLTQKAIKLSIFYNICYRKFVWDIPFTFAANSDLTNETTTATYKWMYGRDAQTSIFLSWPTSPIEGEHLNSPNQFLDVLNYLFGLIVG